MEQKLHTPEGVRDIYNRECEIKRALCDAGYKLTNEK